MKGRNEKIIQIDVLLAKRIRPRIRIFADGSGVAATVFSAEGIVVECEVSLIINYYFKATTGRCTPS